LGGIALTDHDTIDGLPEFTNCNVSTQLARVPGVEIGAEFNGREAHILGFFVPYDAEPLRLRLEWLESSRRTRFPKMVQRLRNLGIDIDQAEIDRVLEGVRTPGRPHLARVLVQKGIVSDTAEAFGLYLGKDKPAYVKRERMDAVEAISLLRSVGGVPVLAHPFMFKVDNLEHTIIQLRSAGLEGVEVHYDYTHAGIENSEPMIVQLAEQMGLIGTGGSDYHGDSLRPDLGSVTVPLSVIDELRAIAQSLGSSAA
jgi:predicted metal-dependent phosphoesterase TrpH